jgi:hypothetical protein
MRRPGGGKGMMLWRVVVSVRPMGTPRNRMSKMILVVLRVGLLLLLLQLLIVPVKWVAVRVRRADLTVRTYSDQLV